MGRPNSRVGCLRSFIELAFASAPVPGQGDGPSIAALEVEAIE